MTDTDEDMVLCGRGLDKWYGAKHERRQVLFGVDVDVRVPTGTLSGFLITFRL